MHKQITFTPYEIVQMVLWICGAIVTISASITIIVKAWQKSKEPENLQDERISALEKRADKIEQRTEQLFDNDDRRLIELEKGTRVTQQTLLALVSHALNGDDIDSLKQAKSKLETFLISKEE